MILSLAGTWQCLETLLVIMTGRATGIEWVEARMLLNILQCTGQPSDNKEVSGSINYTLFSMSISLFLFCK